jgi:hypothetical protein
MPNKTKRHKRGGAQRGSRSARIVRKGDSVKALLGVRGGLMLGRVSKQAARQKEWRQWLEDKLPAEAVERLSGVVERGDTLVVFTESAVWSARVRYAVAEIEPLIKEECREIQRVEVRVMPKVQAP